MASGQEACDGVVSECGVETWLDELSHSAAVGHRRRYALAFAYSAQAVQVAVDRATGKVQVLRVVAAADDGRALNPLAMRGQVEGGIVMGIGTALTEEYKVEEGIPLTRRWKDYRTPLMTDMPEIDVHLAENPTAAGPYRAKGVGELPIIPTAPAICNAICNATGVRVYRLPVKPDELVKEGK